MRIREASDEYAKRIRHQFQKNRGADVAPTGIYFYAFTEEHMARLETDVRASLERLGSKIVEINCAGKRYREVLGEFAGSFGSKAKRPSECYAAIEAGLHACEAFTMLLLYPSRMKATRMKRLECTRELIKFFCDEYYFEDLAKSDVVIVDSPSFLENAGKLLMTYVTPIAALNPMDAFELDEPDVPVLI